MKIFLDSCVLIEIFRKRLTLDKRQMYFVNPIVYAELGYGFVSIGRNLTELDKFIEANMINLVDIDLETAKIFALEKYRLRNKPIADNDLLIACTCLENKIDLWTLNKKHFNRVKGLSLVQTKSPDLN